MQSDRPAQVTDQFADGGRMRGYPGAKAGAGVYQAIINEIPPHRVYVEPFVGSGQIFLRKKPAPCSILGDADAAVFEHWCWFARSVPNLNVVHADARSLIGRLAGACGRGWFFYCDPPYVRSTRRRASPLYRHEFTDADHVELLTLLRSLPARVMVSGYDCDLYGDALPGWRRVDFKATTRGGPAVESLWCNFDTVERHEWTYLGATYRQRQDVKRKRARWRARLAAIPPVERRALLAELLAVELAASGLPMVIGGAAEPRATAAMPLVDVAAGASVAGGKG